MGTPKAHSRNVSEVDSWVGYGKLGWKIASTSGRV
jgi:hypothetical protein